MLSYDVCVGSVFRCLIAVFLPGLSLRYLYDVCPALYLSGKDKSHAEQRAVSIGTIACKGNRQGRNMGGLVFDQQGSISGTVGLYRPPGIQAQPSLSSPSTAHGVMDPSERYGRHTHARHSQRGRLADQQSLRPKTHCII